VGVRDVDEWSGLNNVLVSHCQAIGRDPAEIRRSVHLPWPPDAEPDAMAGGAAAFAAAGVDLVVFSMRGPYEARLLEPLAVALAG
jgi:hypothetical protein